MFSTNLNISAISRHEILIDIISRAPQSGLWRIHTGSAADLKNIRNDGSKRNQYRRKNGIYRTHWIFCRYENNMQSTNRSTVIKWKKERKKWKGWKVNIGPTADLKIIPKEGREKYIARNRKTYKNTAKKRERWNNEVDEKNQTIYN